MSAILPRRLRWPLAVACLAMPVLAFTAPQLWPLLPFWARAALFLGSAGGLTLALLLGLVWFFRQ